MFSWPAFFDPSIVISRLLSYANEKQLFETISSELMASASRIVEDYFWTSVHFLRFNLTQLTVNPNGILAVQ